MSRSLHYRFYLTVNVKSADEFHLPRRETIWSEIFQQNLGELNPLLEFSIKIKIYEAKHLQYNTSSF